MARTTIDADFEAQLKGFSLTTAEILYRLPDHPALLQSYIWQDYDLHPRFPKLKSFLDFWVGEARGQAVQGDGRPQQAARACRGAPRRC